MAPPSAPGSLVPGSVVGGYVVEARLGSGGMGEVWRARDPSLLRPVALKLLSPESAANPSTRARFIREGRAAAALVHPNVVTIYGAGEEAGQTFLAMELVEGQTFRLASPYAPVVRRLAWLLDVARALGAVHRAGFVHRDVKPDNVMVTSGRGAKLLDFGVARAPAVPTDGPPGLGRTGTGQVIGTPRYIAPEQWRGGSVDGRTDQFAWGVMAYEALSGRHPDDASPGFGRVADWRAPATPLHTLAADLPFGISAIVGRALAVFPDQRFPSMEALVVELEAATAGAGLGAAPGTAASAPAAPTELELSRTSGSRGPARDDGARTTNRAAVFAAAVLAVPLLAIAGVGIALVMRVSRDPLAASPSAASPPFAAPPASSPASAGASVAVGPGSSAPAAAASPAAIASVAPRPGAPRPPLEAPSAGPLAAPTKPSLCQRYTGVTVNASGVQTAPGPAREAWERALTAPLLACAKAGPDRFCRGKSISVEIEIDEFPNGTILGFVMATHPETGFEASDDAFSACVAAALPVKAPRPNSTPRYGGPLVLRFSP